VSGPGGMAQGNATAGEPPWLSPQGLAWAARILAAHRRAYGLPLLAGPAERPLRLQAQELFATAHVVLAHDGGVDPRLTYANAAALRLWRRPWASLVGMPSRLTAEPAERQARAGALALALQRQAIANYRGIRIDSQGRRFRIEGARLWTLCNEAGEACGQAACFESWWWL
jgi:hypothetical protein